MLPVVFNFLVGRTAKTHPDRTRSLQSWKRNGVKIVHLASWYKPADLKDACNVYIWTQRMNKYFHKMVEYKFYTFSKRVLNRTAIFRRTDNNSFCAWIDATVISYKRTIVQTLTATASIIFLVHADLHSLCALSLRCSEDANTNFLKLSWKEVHIPSSICAQDLLIA